MLSVTALPKVTSSVHRGKGSWVAVALFHRFIIFLFCKQTSIIFLFFFPSNFARFYCLTQDIYGFRSCTTTHGRVSEDIPLGIQRWWHSNSYSIWANTKFVSLMYKHTPMPPLCHGTVYMYTPSLAKPAAFFRTVERFPTS